MTDQQLIRSLGGPTAVSKMLGFDKGGVQRVQNWISRGIPARIKLDHPHIFLAGIQANKQQN
jgi:hypothetical protein